MSIWSELFYKISCFFSVFIVLTMSSVFASNAYENIRLVANRSIYNAHHVDSRLMNPWGLTITDNRNLVVAVNNNNTVLSTAYFPDGNIFTPAFVINGNFSPTGLETNESKIDFLIPATTVAARFLFATKLGTILAYNANISATTATQVVNRSAANSVYTGLALGYIGHSVHQSIFAADFFNAQIDVFDYQFNYTTSFTDNTVPVGYSPFNIQNFNGLLYVTYAKQDPADPLDDLAGPGNGFVDIFSTDGTLIKRLISHDELNSPWGIAIAPDDYGEFCGALLVGNFGDGRINAYDKRSGEFLGTLADECDNDLIIDGLWALEFGPNECCEQKLYYTSGPCDEKDGLVGVIILEDEEDDDVDECPIYSSKKS